MDNKEKNTKKTDNTKNTEKTNNATFLHIQNHGFAKKDKAVIIFGGGEGN